MVFNSKDKEIISRNEPGSVYSQGDFYFVNLGNVEMAGGPSHGRKMSSYVLNYQISPLINHWVMVPKDLFDKSIKNCNEEELFYYIKLTIKESLLVKQKAVVVNESLYAAYNIIDGISLLVHEFTGKAKYITKYNLKNKQFFVNIGDFELSFFLNRE